MCDYRLELVASRPAKVGDKLISAGFPHTISRGFASLDEPKVAVCLLPGTQLAFEDEVRCEAGLCFPASSATGEFPTDQQGSAEPSSRRA
jgi:hypothetical protein